MKKIVENLKRVSGCDFEENVILYGLDGLASGITSVLILLLISVITGKIADLWCFLFIHMIGCRYTGSYHAKTRVRCQMLTVFSFLTVKLLTNAFFLYVDKHIMCYVLSLGVIYICLNSPVLNIAKPLPVKKIWKNKTKASIFFAFLGVLFFTLIFSDSYKWMASSIMANVIEVVFFMLVGKEVYECDKKKSCDRLIEAS